MADPMKPFADDESAMSIGGLTVENGTDRISISGSLDIAKDRQGLDHVKALHALLEAVVAALGGEGDLPAKAAPSKPAATSKKVNPFA